MVDPLIALMGKILAHIPDNSDPSLAILKGHLIVEEELNKALASKVINSIDIEEARLTFNQLMLVTKAHYATEGNAWCWDALTKLNKIRNSLSHNLEPPDLEKYLVEFVDLVEKRLGTQPGTDFQERLRHALAILAAQVHGFWRSEDHNKRR
jgi:hypothetical protein